MNTFKKSAIGVSGAAAACLLALGAAAPAFASGGHDQWGGGHDWTSYSKSYSSHSVKKTDITVSPELNVLNGDIGNGNAIGSGNEFLNGNLSGNETAIGNGNETAIGNVSDVADVSNVGNVSDVVDNVTNVTDVVDVDDILSDISGWVNLEGMFED